MRVVLGEKFKFHYKNFPISDRKIIFEFITHVEENGFDGLHGRNKRSDDVPKDNPNWAKEVTHAQTHKLWHYHIGIPSYTQSDKGDFTSEYILHYILEQDFIVIVDMSSHPPFLLPTGDYLTY